MHPVISRTSVRQLTGENRGEAHYLTWGKWLQKHQSPPRGSFGHIPGSPWCEPQAAEKCLGSECTHRSTWWRGWGRWRDFTCWQSVLPLSSLCTLTEMKSEVETEWKFRPALCHTHLILSGSHMIMLISVQPSLSQTTYSIQQPRCIYRKWCVHALGTRKAHCVASIMGALLNPQGPSWERTSKEVGGGKKGRVGLL